MILDRSRGNLIGGPGPKPSDTQDLHREELHEQIILDSSAPDPFSLIPLFPPRQNLE